MTELTSPHQPRAIFLMGPTASNKTALAMILRHHLPVEIISVDSALVYRGMDIGTAKPSDNELAKAPHRLIDIRDPADPYSVANFCHDALKEMAEISSAGRIPLLVGGTMLYFKALLEGLSSLPPTDSKVRACIKRKAEIMGWRTLHQQLQKIDPIAASYIHPNDSQRLSRALEVFFISGNTLTEMKKMSSKKALAYQVYQFATMPLAHELLHRRIAQRFYQMLAAGFEYEVMALFSRSDLHPEMPSIRCVGYRQMWSYLAGESNYDDMVFRGICATRQLAKRQMTWLRGWRDIHWINGDTPITTLDRVLHVVSAWIK